LTLLKYQATPSRLFCYDTRLPQAKKKAATWEIATDCEVYKEKSSEVQINFCGDLG
jgi:hypothetical protein